MTPWAYDALQKIGSYSTLKPGWDSYGAAEISDEAIINAKAFVRDLGDDTPKPIEVVPTNTGGVRLIWNGKCGELELEFGPDGKAFTHIDRINRFDEQRDGYFVGLRTHVDDWLMEQTKG